MAYTDGANAYPGGLLNGELPMPGVPTSAYYRNLFTESGNAVSVDISDITSDTNRYCFSAHCNMCGIQEIQGAIQINSATSNAVGKIEVLTSTDQVIDSGQFALSTISNDQIAISAAVDPTFTFSLSSNAQALGTLSTIGVISGTGIDTTVTTNAAAGWMAWVRSANTALTSVATSGTIPTSGSLDNSPTQLVAGTPGYVLDANLTTDDATAGSGTVSIAGEYNGTLSDSGGTLSTLYQSFASATGPTSTDVITLVPRLSISGLTPAAGDYTDTLTVVAAGRF